LAGRGEPERPTRIGQWGESSAISSVSSLMLGEPSPLMPLLTSPWSAAGWTGPTQSRSSPLRSSYLPKHRSVRAIGQWYQSSNSYHHLTGQRGGEPGEECAFSRTTSTRKVRATAGAASSGHLEEEIQADNEEHQVWRLHLDAGFVLGQGGESEGPHSWAPQTVVFVGRTKHQRLTG